MVGRRRSSRCGILPPSSASGTTFHGSNADIFAALHGRKRLGSGHSTGPKFQIGQHLLDHFRIARSSFLVGPSYTFCSQRGNEYYDSQNMLNGTFIIKEQKGKKEGGCFSCRRRNRHGQSAKLFGDCGRTRTPKKAHTGKQDHDGNFPRRTPRSIFQRNVLELFVVGTRLQHPCNPCRQIPLYPRGTDYGHQRDAVHSKYEFVLSYAILVHDAFGHVGNGTVAQQRDSQHNDSNRLKDRRRGSIGMHKHGQTDYHAQDNCIVNHFVSLMRNKNSKNHCKYHSR
mmetsp:Transcript_21756/g.35016  ORF Transcript_21756/g.35016 Transcript_21756/m.35016 type:complete len:283 (-) Transcript_21756:199-1047(-)